MDIHNYKLIETNKLKKYSLQSQISVFQSLGRKIRKKLLTSVISGEEKG